MTDDSPVLDRLRADSELALMVRQAAALYVPADDRERFAPLIWNLLGMAYCMGKDVGIRESSAAMDAAFAVHKAKSA